MKNDQKSGVSNESSLEIDLQKSLKEAADYKYALEESCIVAITDQKGIIKYANDNFCTISKYSRDELIGQDHRIINSGFHSTEFIRNLWVTIANGKIWRGELKNKAKDGSFYWVDTTIVPFLNESGKPYQYVAIRSDITMRKEAEQENNKLKLELEERVKQRTEELEAFSYSISHDLRAPLRAVNGYAKILEEDYEKMFDAEGKRLLNVIQENAKKMGVLIDDLLAFSRLGQKEIRMSFIDSNELVESVWAEVGKTAEQPIQFKISKLHSVIADRSLLGQVFINLLSNAVKYSSKTLNPVVEVESRIDDHRVIFSIHDNGAGFDNDYAHKLFGVFQRLHSPEEFEGTGVGLALVKRIVEKHHGSVWAESELSKGATFYFSLPEIVVK